MTVNFTDLFTRLGHAFYVGEASNTTLGTTVPTRVNAFLAGLGTSLGAQFETVRESILGAQNAFQQAGASGNAGLIQQPCQNLILQTVKADKPVASTLALAIRELIKQMEDNSESLDASTVGSSLAYDAGNIGTGVGLVSTKRADGKNCLFAYAEAIRLTCLSVSNGEAQFGVVAPPLIDPLMPTWPGGSGADTQTIGKTASSGTNLVPNGTFEENDDQSVHLPLGWIAPTATLGTTLKMGSVEVQTVIISSTPSGGYYLLHWTNAAGQPQTTVPIAYDAGESTVQAALRGLVGLEAVEVVTTGTSPDYTHTITFYGVTNPAQLTSTDNTVSGAIAHATTTAASANVMRGARSVEFDSNGSQLTTIQVPVTLTALTQYAFNCFMKTDSVPAAGVLTIDLVDGVGGTVIADQAGTNNSFTVDATALTTSFVAKTGVFRTPLALPTQVHLRIRITTAVSNTSSVFLDECYLGLMDESYAGGPSLAVFDGAVAWLPDDLITATITQDREGKMLEWLDRILGLRESGLMFPVNTGGLETQADSLIA